MTPFDFINAINNKQDLKDISKDDIEKGYNAFLTNRFFSFFNDTVFYANELNKYSGDLSNEQQLYFYYNLIPKKRRYTKWQKKQDSSVAEKADIDTVRAYYEGYCPCCSTKEAKQILTVLKCYSNNNEILTEMKSEVTKGGK